MKIMNKPVPLIEPHPVLSPHYQAREEKARFLRGIFDASAPHYEGIASWGFFGSGHWYRVNALKLRGGLKPGMKCLDIAAGTGPTARAVAEVAGGPGYVTCVEPSFGMLKESLKLLPSDHIQGCADAIPLADDVFDFMSMGFALRHVENLRQAFGEYHRVLKPGGKLFIMDVTKPENRFLLLFHNLYFGYVLPWMTRVITRSESATYLMQYYWETMDKMVDPQMVVATLKDAGFIGVEHHLVLGCFTEYRAEKG
jgi:demethylmenaquinone methyltransferase / 2-methoxy-6-polyprenyl-1,4-benzoquinol methylase